jgi:mono/diheme cytochrome c family protein
MQRGFRSLRVIDAAIVIGALTALWSGVLTPGDGRALAAGPAVAQQPAQVAPGLVLPPMDPVRGKALFASKGCVVCHSINGIGGHDAPALDAATMAPQMNPFDFAADMWRGAAPMIMMQQTELGHQIEFTGQDLADIVAFVHNPEVQRTFAASDIPSDINKLMEEPSGKDEAEGSSSGMMRGGGMSGGAMGGGMMKGGGMSGGAMGGGMMKGGEMMQPPSPHQ